MKTALVSIIAIFLFLSSLVLAGPANSFLLGSASNRALNNQTSPDPTKVCNSTQVLTSGTNGLSKSATSDEPVKTVARALQVGHTRDSIDSPSETNGRPNYYSSPLGHDSGLEANLQSYATYEFFVGNVWTNPTSSFTGGFSVTFDGVSNTVGGIMSNDWVAILPINMAYGSATTYSWVQFAIIFNYGGSTPYFVVEQNNYANGKMDMGVPANGREWSTGGQGAQLISVPYAVGHTFFASLFVVDSSHVQFSITDDNTESIWSKTMDVPSENVLYMTDSFSPATTIEGNVSTTVTSITGFPYMDIDIINQMESLAGNNGVSLGGPSLPPAGVDYYPVQTFAPGWWRWAALSDLSLLPTPVVQLVSYQSIISLGQTDDIDIPVANIGNDANWMTVQVSFPTFQVGTVITVDSAGTTVPSPQIYSAGYVAPSGYAFRVGTSSSTVAISYPFVEGGGGWSAGTIKHLKVHVTPSSTGSFQFLVKSVAAYQTRAISWDPTIDTGAVQDQQAEYAYRYTINVGVNPSSISISVGPASINLGSGTSVTGSITSSVSGDKSGTVYVQYSSDGTTWNLAGTTTSSSSGSYSYWWTPSATGTFHVRSYWNGNVNYGGATSSSVTLTVTSPGGNLADHSMCKGVQGSAPNILPVTRTNTFYTDDEGAYSWVQFSNIYGAGHLIHWDCYDPDGNVVGTLTWHVTDPGAGNHWPVYGAYFDMDIIDFQSWFADRVGRPFQIKVYYDGSLVVTETWTVLKHSSSISVSLSSNSINYGQSLTVSSQISPSSSDGTTTLQYSTDGTNWNSIASGTPTNGYYSSTWTPPNTGNYYLHAVWSGDLKYYDSTSSTKTLTVTAPPLGSIIGRVTDESNGNGIPSATVSYSGPSSGSVLTDSNGYYTVSSLVPGSYSVTASMSGYNSQTVLSATVNPGGTTTLNFQLEASPPSAFKSFDFGTAGSPVASGYVQVTESTVYSGALGYGWDSAVGLVSRDRGGPTDLRRDLVQSTSDHTFNVDLANGQYKVILTIGDQSYMHDLIDVFAEGILQVNHLTVNAGKFSTQIFTVAVSDGQLNIKFHENGGSDYNWVINAIIVQPAAVGGKFDFGTAGSPVASGYVQVTESTVYSGALGYGWDSAVGLVSRDRGGPTDLRRDLVQSTSDHTFNVDLANGQYKVILTIGDQSYMHDLIDVFAEGILQVNHLTVSAGTFSTQVFTVTVSDGQLNLKFHDAGGSDGNWVINAIIVQQAAVGGQFDFGTYTSPVEPGYVKVNESTGYSAVSGYGWDSTTGLASRDRGGPDDLRRDLVQSTSDHTFNVDLANGNYKVTLTIGDQSYMHDLIDVFAEGVLQVNHLTVNAGTFSPQVFTVTVSDGQLNLKFHDAGGSDGNWVINAITIQAAA